MSNPYTTNLVLDLDPSTLALSDGTVVSSGFNDSSGAGNNVTTYQGSPTFKSNIFGSLPAVRFGAAANDGLSGSFASWAGGTGITLIIAAANFVSSAAPGGYAAAINAGGSDNVAPGALLYDDGTSTDTVLGSASVILSRPIGTSVVFGSARDATTYTQMVNGGVTTKSTFSGSIGTMTLYAVGQRAVSGSMATTAGCKYDLGRLLIYKEKLSDANLKSVGLWLAQLVGAVNSSGGGGAGGISAARVLNGV